MLTYEARRRVSRSPEAVFDVIGTHVYENHPKWESEVVEIRPLTEPPVRVGSRAVMVRREYGRRSEVAYEVTDFDQDRRIAFRHISAQMAFEIAFVLEPAGEGGSDLSVQIRAQPKGVFGLMTPLVARNLPRTSERITSQMVALLLDPSAGNEESPIRTQIGPMRAGLVPHAGFPVRRLMCLSSVHPVPRRDA